ncbi:MAG: hypothetical protein PHF11_04895 [Candidatus Omnitrophica bacterium]|nr:hypothetical protein [Candidatus Omnitrophota bacterium]
MAKIRGDSLIQWTIVIAAVSASFILVRTYFKDALRRKVETASAYLLWNGTSYAPQESSEASKAITYSNQSQTSRQVERKDAQAIARFYDYGNVTSSETSYSASAEEGAGHILKNVNVSAIAP